MAISESRNARDRAFAQYAAEQRVADNYRHAFRAVTGLLFVAAIAGFNMWPNGYHAAIASWIALVAVIGITRILFLLPRPPRVLARLTARWSAERKNNGLAWFGLANGVTWGTGAVLAAQIATPAQFYMIAMLSAGLMGAAVMSYGATARPAIAFLVPAGLGCIGAWASFPGAAFGPGAAMVLAYMVVLSRGALSNEAHFLDKIENQYRFRESADTVQLLLNDYEAQASDWLWELDRDGCIVNPVRRFADAAGHDVASLAGRDFLSFFEKSAERERLADAIRSGRPFRDLSLEVSIDGARRWWRLSARPDPTAAGMRGVASDVTAQKEAEARVNHMAHFDGLTDLANRALFNTQLGQALDRMTGPRQVAVLCIDLDQFKSVNDTLGHPVGDVLLCRVARRIEQAVDGAGLVARLGGDEFAILLQGSGNLAERTEALSDAIVEAIGEPCSIEGHHVTTGASIGVAMADRLGVRPAELMKHADLALYSAKATGRNCMARFEPAMVVAAQERRDLEMGLRVALKSGQLDLHFQPLYDIDTNKIICAEALLRWHHPIRGTIMPAQFIPIAEETGLIVPVGEWVIREAAMAAARLPRHVRVAINLSPAQMRSKTLLATVFSAIAHAGIKPDRLELEITESVFMHDSEANIAILHRLRELGVRVALDDFGTGYSSLNYLRRFPFDKIKIDRCFLEGLRRRGDSQAIIRAITDLASSLGMSTTAEGVEDEEQLGLIAALGCDEVQGFHVGEPRAFADLIELTGPCDDGRRRRALLNALRVSREQREQMPVML